MLESDWVLESYFELDFKRGSSIVERVEETEAAKNLDLRQRQPREDLGESEGSERMPVERVSTI